MKINEIRNYTANGSVCVDISILSEYSGFVRKVIFYTDNRVCIEFIGYGIEEEIGYEYCKTFNSIKEAVAIIEDYIDRPLSQWINYTKTGIYPKKPQHINIDIGESKLLSDISKEKIRLPAKAIFKANFDYNYFT